MDQRLVLVGYWSSLCDDPTGKWRKFAEQAGYDPDAEFIEKSTDEEARWPNPRLLVDPAWEAHDRPRIIEYLNSGVVFRSYLGHSPCRFGCMLTNGARELTDGVYVWPEGLAHYVDQHEVRLPAELVAQMRSNHFCVPQFDLHQQLRLEYLEVNTGFWEEWSAGIEREPS